MRNKPNLGEELANHIAQRKQSIPEPFLGKTQKPTILQPLSENRIVEQRKFFNVKQLAEYLGISEKTIYGWVYRGVIEPQRIGPRLIRFDVEKIEKWISQKGNP